MSRVTIRSTGAPGFNGRYRAGRFWPSTGTEIDLLSSEEDGPDINEKGVTIPQLGTKSIAIIRADKSFTVDNMGALLDAQSLRVENAQLRARIAELSTGVTPTGVTPTGPAGLDPSDEAKRDARRGK